MRVILFLVRANGLHLERDADVLLTVLELRRRLSSRPGEAALFDSI